MLRKKIGFPAKVPYTLKDMADEGLIQGNRTAFHRMGGLPRVSVLRVIDIDTDPRLVALYGWEIPVVVVDGRKHAKLRLDERRFADRIARAARGEVIPDGLDDPDDKSAPAPPKEVSP